MLLLIGKETGREGLKPQFYCQTDYISYSEHRGGRFLLRSTPQSHSHASGHTCTQLNSVRYLPEQQRARSQLAGCYLMLTALTHAEPRSLQNSTNAPWLHHARGPLTLVVACTVHQGGLHYVALYHGAFLLFSPDSTRMAVRQSKRRARSSVLLEAVKGGVF